MGDGRQKQAQNSNDVAASIVDGSFSPSDIVGKRTLTGDLAAPSGDAYIDHHALCTRTTSTDCFLDPESRTALIGDYKQLVGLALDAYQRALLEIRMDELVKKDDELPWVVTVLLDVVSVELLGGVTRALKQLKADKLAALTAAAALDAEGARQATAQASTAYVALSMVSDEQLGTIAKSSFDAGKKSAVAGIKKRNNASNDDAKPEKLSYLVQLSGAATMAYESLRTVPPAAATDAQLLVLWRSFKPPAHSQELYKVLIEEKIKRYMNSGIRDIGRAPETLRADEAGSPSAAVGAMKDTVVVRVKFKSGYPDKFAFARKDFAIRTQSTLPQERAPESDLPLDETKFHGQPIADQARIQMQPGFERFIEPEFVDAAIARHIEVWAKEPEIIDADDSSWTWDKARSETAKENKENGPGPFGIPKLELRSRTESPVTIPYELRLQGPIP